MDTTIENTTTASHSVSQGDDITQIYPSKFKFNFDEQEDLVSLEQQLKKNIYLKDDILSVDDALVFEDLRMSKAIIIEKVFPYTYKWCKTLERLRNGWRISKKKDKGSTFPEYIKKAEDKLRQVPIENNDLITGLTPLTETTIPENFMSKSPKSSKYKKLNEYHMEIGVKFKCGMTKNWTEIASNLSIICQIYLPRDTEIKPIKDEKTGDIYAVIVTRTHKEKYDISSLEADIKRNIAAVESLHIIEIKEIKNNYNENNSNNNNTNTKNYSPSKFMAKY